jgi:hypothetical protein
MRGRVAVLLSGLLVLSCGGGGHGPTEPEALPQVAGTWNGDWGVGNVGLRSALSLTQNGNAIQGTFSVLGLGYPIAGTVDGNLKIHWMATGFTCGSLTGDGTVNALNATQMDAQVDFNSVSCGGRDMAGPGSWSRSGPAAVAGKAANVQDLPRRLEQLWR